MLGYLKSLKRMTLDIVQNRKRIQSLALFEYKLSCKGLFFGQLWKLLLPVIQIGAYWFVFGVGIRSGAPVDGIPYVVWLTCGITPWFIMNTSVTRTANSVYSKATLLTRSNVPTCIIPVSTILACFLDGLWTIGLMFVIYFANGQRPSWAALNLIYYMLCAFLLMVVLSFITTVLVMLARDYQKMIQMGMRLLFFLSPIFWRPGGNMPLAFTLFDQWNPFGYVIRGFRSSLLYNISFWQDGRCDWIFWATIGVLYLLGVAFQRKLRSNLLDYL